jgi:hypothetical protein
MYRLRMVMRAAIEMPQLRAVSLRMRSFMAFLALGSIRTLTSPLRRKKQKPKSPRLVAGATGVEIAPDELEHPLVPHTSCETCHHGIVVDSIKEAVEIDIDDPSIALFDVAPGGLNRHVGASAGTEPEAHRREVWVEDGDEHLRKRLADEAI